MNDALLMGHQKADESLLHAGCGYGKRTRFGDGERRKPRRPLPWWTDGHLNRTRTAVAAAPATTVGKVCLERRSLTAVRFASALFSRQITVSLTSGVQHLRSIHPLSLSSRLSPFFALVVEPHRLLRLALVPPRTHPAATAAAHLAALATPCICAYAPLRAGVGR